jgi:glycosyltransferase involved in cell wall biosynthesis
MGWPCRLVYLPFGLAMTNLSIAEPATRSARLRIGYLGQFTPHKGVHLLLSAFQTLAKPPDSCESILHSSVSAASPYERRLLRMARNDPAITFAGPYPNVQVGQVLDGLDVIVVPSVWYENRPTVILKAHATGTPVVAARLGGMAELIQPGQNRLLFEPGSARSLTAQRQRLLDEPALLPRLQAGIEPVPSIEEEAGTLVSLHKSLLPPLPGGRGQG